MKFVIGIVLILWSISSYSQYTPDTFSDEQLELLEGIQSDGELYEYYNSGVRKLDRARTLGITSLVLMGTTVLSLTLASQARDLDNQFFIGIMGYVISSAGACVIGTKALLTRRKGRKRIRESFDAARGDLNSEFYGGFDIQVTSNGIGLVYSF